MKARVAALPQNKKLVNAMKAAGVRHNSTVRADIGNVRIETTPGGTGAVFFCNLRALEVKKSFRTRIAEAIKRFSAQGDDGAFANEATINGLTVEQPGFYNLRNVELSPNGSNTVTVDERSEIQFVGSLEESSLYRGAF